MALASVPTIEISRMPGHGGSRVTERIMPGTVRTIHAAPLKLCPRKRAELAPEISGHRFEKPASFQWFKWWAQQGLNL